MAVGKKITDLTASGSLKDTDLAIVHDGNGTKKSTLTQLSEYMGTKFSNPNLLINPDFKINQRGKTEYAYQSSGATQYTIDRFRAVFLNVKTASDGLILNANGTNDGGGYISQVLEDAVKGDTILSFKVSAVAGTIEFRNLNSTDGGITLSVTSDGTYNVKGNNTKKVIAHLFKGSSCKIEWVKLEQGSNATPFVAPNPTEELVKCQRFCEYIAKSIAIPLIYNTRNATDNLKYYIVDKIYKIEKRIKPTISVNEITDSGEAGINVGRTLSIDKDGTLTITFNASLSKFSLKVKNIIVDAEIY